MGNRLRQASLFVGTLAFGLVISPALDFITSPAISTINRILLAGLLLVAFVLLVAVNAALVLAKTQQEQFASISSDVTSIIRRLGLTVQFFSETTGHGKTDPYAVISGLIASAQKEILILDHRPDLTGARFYAQSPSEAAARKRYYDAMTEKALSTTSDGTYFRYSRIVQLEDGPTSKWDTTPPDDTLFAEHCRAIIDFRKNHAKAACVIRTSRVFFSKSTIVIVDGVHVLMELCVVDPDGRTKVEGDLLFTDSDGLFSKPLRQLFGNIESQSMLLTEVGLPTPSATGGV